MQVSRYACADPARLSIAKDKCAFMDIQIDSVARRVSRWRSYMHKHPTKFDGFDA